jgi:hypothetical protein
MAVINFLKIDYLEEICGQALTRGGSKFNEKPGAEFIVIQQFEPLESTLSRAGEIPSRSCLRSS